MMFSLSFLLLVCSFAVSLVVADHSEDHDGKVLKITWQDELQLATKRSDLSATGIYYDQAVEADKVDAVYLVGGCDADQTMGDFGPACQSITNKCEIFYPVTNPVTNKRFGTCADAPEKRYRHSAVGLNDKVWIIGGANLVENFLSTVDVYDVVTDSWETFDFELPDALSDLAAFNSGVAGDNSIYVTGGYISPSYEAQTTTYKIDTAATLSDSTGKVIFATLPASGSMKEGRGDIFAAIHDGVAYVAGGFTHIGGWCDPLPSVETFDFSTETWEDVQVDDLNSARGDKALVELNGRLLAIGGEMKDDQCDKFNIPLDDVEVLDIETGEWTVETDIPEARFRFVAAPHPETDSVFLFGGQSEWNVDCECFKVTDTVFHYKENFVNDNIDGSAAALSTAGAAGIIGVFSFVFAMLF